MGLFLGAWVISNSFLIGGWRGTTLYFSGWVPLNLGIMALFSLGLIHLRERHVVLRVLSNLTVLFRVLFFGAQRLLVLFMTFELVRLPVIIMVHYYGIQPEKIRAVYYMIVYTGVFGMSFFYVIMSLESMRFYISPLLSVFMVGLFLVKSPLWGLHLWLPKAHVEAPTTGSMLLAGLLLKVGLYGLLKVCRWRGINPSWALLLATMGYLVGPVASLTSRDTKQLVAYSSVSHINLTISGVLIVAPGLFTRSYLVALSHGYVSALVFFAMGEMAHGSGTRIVYYASGVSRVSRLLAVTYCLALLANAGVPPYLSFWGELIVIGGILRVESLLISLLFCYFLLALYYNAFLIMRLVKGSSFKYRVTGLAVLFTGLVPLVLVILYLY